MPNLEINADPTVIEVPAPKPADGRPNPSAGVQQQFFKLRLAVFGNSHRWLGPVAMMLAICALVFLVYRPLLPGVFLMDDHRVMADDNPLVDGEFTLGNIWFQTDFVLSNIVFWAQWLLWGNHPGGYHAVNMALHALSAILLWRVLVRLRIPGAWLAALIYAVHPVAVTSVARIAELKNTLSLPFFLLSFWAYLRYEGLPAPNVRSTAITPIHDSEVPKTVAADKSIRTLKRPEGRAPVAICSGWYCLSLLAFTLALLSKTSTIMLPAVLVLYVWWRHGKFSQQQGRPLIPYFALSLIFGIMSAWFQKYQALADQPLPPRGLGERLAIAGHSIWFYLGKDWLPLQLNALYPRWIVNAASVTAYLPGLLMVAVLALAWRFRRSWGRHLIFGLGCFVITLFPVLGFFDGQYLVWFQVSDHLQYLPMIAPVALAGAALAGVLGAIPLRFAAVILIAGLVMLASERARIFSNEESLMRDCLAKNPAAWGAQNTLGTILAGRNDLAGAVTNFETALTYEPNDPPTQLNLAHVLVLQGKIDDAEPHFLAALMGKPIDPEGRRQFASALEKQGRNPEALTQWRIAAGLKSSAPIRLGYAALLFKTGDLPQAVVQLRRVVLDQPDLPEPLNNLAWLLATCADEQVRNGADAVRYAEAACLLTQYKQAGMVGTLAAAYAEAGRFPEAVKTCRQAIDLANTQGNPQFAAINQQLLRLYQADQPYHAQPAVAQ